MYCDDKLCLSYSLPSLASACSEQETASARSLAFVLYMSWTEMLHLDGTSSYTEDHLIHTSTQVMNCSMYTETIDVQSPPQASELCRTADCHGRAPHNSPAPGAVVVQGGAT